MGCKLLFFKVFIHSNSFLTIIILFLLSYYYYYSYYYYPIHFLHLGRTGKHEGKFCLFGTMATLHGIPRPNPKKKPKGRVWYKKLVGETIYLRSNIRI
jgi:hypothetical protein